MLQDLPFLEGASAVMEQVAYAGPDQPAPTLAAEVVRVADDYDLLLHGDGIGPSEALERMRTRTFGSDGDRVVAALVRAVRARDDAAAGGSTVGA